MWWIQHHSSRVVCMTCVSSMVSRRYCVTSSRRTQPLAIVLGPKSTSGGLQNSVVSYQPQKKKKVILWCQILNSCHICYVNKSPFWCRKYKKNAVYFQDKTLELLGYFKILSACHMQMMGNNMDLYALLCNHFLREVKGSSFNWCQ